MEDTVLDELAVFLVEADLLLLTTGELTVRLELGLANRCL